LFFSSTSTHIFFGGQISTLQQFFYSTPGSYGCGDVHRLGNKERQGNWRMAAKNWIDWVSWWHLSMKKKDFIDSKIGDLT
jgi:hypothetical protein